MKTKCDVGIANLKELQKAFLVGKKMRNNRRSTAHIHTHTHTKKTHKLNAKRMKTSSNNTKSG